MTMAAKDAKPKNETQAAAASPEIQAYFGSLQTYVKNAYRVARTARGKGLDPKTDVEIKPVKNMAERVVGLISIIAPQLGESAVAKTVAARIMELEKEYGALDWRVALKIAEEIALETYCRFEDQHQAIEVGVRTGFAYLTLGTVSSPLDGMTRIELKNRLDGKGKYFCVHYAGPMRNAGGTAAAVSAIIADYVRVRLGFAAYDATYEERKRAYSELLDYHERISPRQYVPSEMETLFLVQHLPVEIGGEPSESVEVSNFKDLPRIPTNAIRSGFCLMMTDCIPLKAPKLWKQLGAWGKDFGLEHWGFLEELLALQKKARASQAQAGDSSGIDGNDAGKNGNGPRLSPDFTYLKETVAGRPVLGYPLRHGAFRLRYGRTRTTGFSSHGIHPATMALLNKYIATGTQLKTERPRKGTVVTSCDLLEGPIVKLDDQSVLQLESAKEAYALAPRITEVLYLGDLLVCYGDFFNLAHTLVPAGYCPEWWVKEFEAKCVDALGSLDIERIASYLELPVKRVERLLQQPLTAFPDAGEAISMSKKLLVPLHPKYTYFWSALSQAQLLDLFDGVVHAKRIQSEQGEVERLVIALKHPAKRALELIGIPHRTHAEYALIEKDHALALLASFGLDAKQPEAVQAFLSGQQNGNGNRSGSNGNSNGNSTNTSNGVDSGSEALTLTRVQRVSSVPLRDRGGTFVGSRMGRPEKAKMRKLTASPHVLFPVGEEGGRMRSINHALEQGKITAQFRTYWCASCSQYCVLRDCPWCKKPAQEAWWCKRCNVVQTQAECSHHGPNAYFAEHKLDVRKLFQHCLRRIDMISYPNLIKGVRGTSNKKHVPEHLAKGILRAKHLLAVNKDGTIRYDMTQLPMTHFKPKEIGTSIARLRELGYRQDIRGKPLERDDQVIELLPQDIVLPACPESGDEGSDTVLFRVSQFVDDLLQHMYGLQPFYNLSTPEDLVGHSIIALAPHTSAGIIGRIIGFSKTQGFFAHPLLHAATRRDCDGDESGAILLMDALLNFSQQYLSESRGGTMDAPLVLTTLVAPQEVDDMVFDVDMAWGYPLALYVGALELKKPWDVKVKQLRHVLGTPDQYQQWGFTHDVDDINDTVRVSAYKILPTMEDKLKGQMDLAEKLRSVESTDVARLVIDKHFLKDAKGNLRRFSTQEFRCVSCNEKFRRPPLIGRCTTCSGKLLFTVSQGNITKYVEPMFSLAKKYHVGHYTTQVLEILQRRIEGVFGKEKEKQTGLGAWFG